MAPRAEEHDRVRGAGTFARTLDGLRRLERCGLLPIVTVTQTHDEDARRVPRALRSRAARRRASGVRGSSCCRCSGSDGRPRARRGYEDDETLAGLSPEAFDPAAPPVRLVPRGDEPRRLRLPAARGRAGRRASASGSPRRSARSSCATAPASPATSTGMTCGNG